ncbi:MAG: SH3 domain-containing protein [Candidatus Omnitrophica bacterium]|nr:SH3 domain-containing protein [Candidatus Omnitrophota bacterium]
MKNTVMILVLVMFLFHGAGYCSDSQTKVNEFEPTLGNVLGDHVNIRAGKGLNFEIIDQIDKGKGLMVIGEDADWYRVKLPKTAQSFVHKDYIKNEIVQGDRLRVRSGPGNNFTVLGVLNEGDRIKVLGHDGDWLKITPPEGCSAWISKKFVRLTKRKYAAEDSEVAVSEEQAEPVEEVEEIEQAEVESKEKVAKKTEEEKTPEIVEAKTRGQKEEKPQEAKKAQSQKETKTEAGNFTGVVQDMGKIFDRPGTHKLTQDGKVIFYLKSENINLNRYVYREVNIVGKVEEPKNSRRYPHPVIDVEEIKVAKQ